MTDNPFLIPLIVLLVAAGAGIYTLIRGWRMPIDGESPMDEHGAPEGGRRP